MSQKRAVALISGGLDSMLAAKVVMEQGVHVEGINFFTGFCHSGHTSAIRNPKKDKEKRNDALWVCEHLGIPLHIEDIVEEYKAILLKPKYGYGKHLNPCLDCKIFMIQKAYEWIKAHDFDFIITGEVIGQRPKSQRRDTMATVEKQSGAKGLLLRPLCAQHLDPTIPELEGWIDREKLLGIQGRGRKSQIDLAEGFHFDGYAQPAGGCCVLTDGNYTRRLQDMWDHQSTRDYDMDDIILLKAGRHIRLNEHLKLIVARDESESRFLEGFRKQFIHLRVEDHRGPLMLLDGKVNEAELKLAASICARYSGGKHTSSVTVIGQNKASEAFRFDVKPMLEEEINSSWYL